MYNLEEYILAQFILLLYRVLVESLLLRKRSDGVDGDGGGEAGDGGENGEEVELVIIQGTFS